MKAEKYTPRNLAARRVKYARNQAKMTQANVAVNLGVTPQQISNYERGTTRIPDAILAKMAKLYGVSIEFLRGEGGKLPGDTTEPSKSISSLRDSLFDLLGDAAGELSDAECQAAFELRCVFNDFLRYIATEHPEALPKAEHCFEVATIKFVSLCEMILKERNGEEFPHDDPAGYRPDELTAEYRAFMKRILDACEAVSAAFARSALSLFRPPEGHDAESQE